MTLEPGMHLGRYKILARLGKGGMGEVFRAKDSNLDRDVAIKILPEHLAKDIAAVKRFEREARAVAALSHPNILSIHDSAMDQGIRYAVMELLEGETLRVGLIGQALGHRKAIEIAIAVADGLSAAHAKGLIHRDLKPENIFLMKDGRVKILDFGLARWASVISDEEFREAPTTSQVSDAGKLIGTVPYMSPEQVRGESLDVRTDIFSLGCVLYEMISGRRAFSGNSAAEITAAILKDDPPHLTDIPLKMRRLVERCLEKNRDERFHSAHDLAFALRNMLGASANRKTIGSKQKDPGKSHMKKIKSLAVLPLKNLSDDKSQEYFADGMTEELIGKLARISSLRVISRTSIMEYKKAHKPLPEIAKELNVDAIVEGSVLQSGKRVRITAQLVHAPTDHHLWSDRYERDVRDILSLQNDIASAIAREIQVKLAPDEAAQFAKAPQVNPQAYQAYLRGLSYAEGQVDEDNLRLRLKMFEKAVELDPNFASAYAELSMAHSFLYFTYDHTAEHMAESKAALDRAFELEPAFAEGHMALGFYYYWGFRDYESALHELRTAGNTLTNNKFILLGEGSIYRRQGRFEEALAVFQKLFAINPRDPQTADEIGSTYVLLRKYADAERYFAIYVSLRPDELTGYLLSADLHLRWKGDTRNARAMLNKVPNKNSRGFVNFQFWIEFFDRNYQAALDILSSPHVDPIRKSLYQGILYRWMKKSGLARTSFETACNQLEQELRRKPDDYDLHGLLGIAYAGLRRKEEAIREGKRSVELLPVSKDTMWGPLALESLAFVHALLGEQNEALDQIEYLLSISFGYGLTRSLVRIDPRWDPLRNHPRFRKLMGTKSNSQV